MCCNVASSKILTHHSILKFWRQNRRFEDWRHFRWCIFCFSFDFELEGNNIQQTSFWAFSIFGLTPPCRLPTEISLQHPQTCHTSLGLTAFHDGRPEHAAVLLLGNSKEQTPFCSLIPFARISTKNPKTFWEVLLKCICGMMKSEFDVGPLIHLVPRSHGSKYASFVPGSCVAEFPSGNWSEARPCHNDESTILAKSRIYESTNSLPGLTYFCYFGGRLRVPLMSQTNFLWLILCGTLRWSQMYKLYKRQKYLMKIEFSKSLHFYSNHGAQIFVGRHRLPVAHSDIQVQLWVGHCPSCGIFSSAGLAETLYLGRGQCSCFNGKCLQLSYSIQVLLVTAVAGVIRLIVCSFIFLSVWRSSNMLFVAYQHFSNQRRSNPIQRCYAFPLLCNFTWAAFLFLLLWNLF